MTFDKSFYYNMNNFHFQVPAWITISDLPRSIYNTFQDFVLGSLGFF